MFLLFVKSFKIKPKIIAIFLVLLLLVSSVLFFVSLANENETEAEQEAKKDFIKWVDFNVTADALNLTAKLDIDSHQNNDGLTYNWIELLAYLACKNGGDFKNFKQKDLESLVSKLQEGQTIEDLTADLKFYDYYYESYQAVLGGFIGNYSIEVDRR